MTQEEINKFNKKCAEFLGWKETSVQFKMDWICVKTEQQLNRIDSSLVPILEKDGNVLFDDFDSMNFFDDWKWIMEVVEAIEKIYDDFHGYFGVYINSNSCTIQGTNLRTDPDNYHPAYFSEHIGEDKKEAVIQAINESLIWYNENKIN